MDLTMLAALIGIIIFLVTLIAGYGVIGKPKTLQDRVVQPEQGPRSKFDWRKYLKRSEHVFKPLGEMIPRSPEELSRQERRLVAAGIRRKDAPIIFYGVKLSLALALFAFFIAGGYFKNNPFLYSILPILLGALIPDIWLSRKMRNRKENIQLAIPDALDLTVVCVEAGLGLDQSLMRIGQELHPLHREFSDELRLLNLEINAGRTRSQALRNLANRTDVDDLKALVAVLIQTDRFGTSVAQSLRVFSDSLRTKRKQRAEERAAKTTIKMLPPLVFFILPAIFVVILAPAIITLINEFLPSLGNK